MEQVKKFPRYFGGLCLRVILAILAGILLLSAVCAMPSGAMDRNMQASAGVFEEEGIYPVLFPWCNSRLDSTTDALILLISACDTEDSPVTQAMSGTWNTLSTAETASNVLAQHYGAGVPFDGSEPYYQYWHGYQVIIRPLLCVLNYSGIRILNGILQTGLLIILCSLMIRCGLKRYILPYLVCVAMLMPVALAMSLQFSSCYYILTLGSIAILLARDHLDQKDGVIFLYIGIATAYFDFLTYPAATLGIPAVFYCCIRKNSPVRDAFCRGVKVCFSWAVGYGLMWAGKWLFGSLILRKNILAIASDKVTERSSGDGNMLHNIHAALSANIKTFLHTPVSILVILLAVIFCIVLLRQLRRKQQTVCHAASVIFPFLVLAIVPIAWYLVTSQHAVIHYWFTNKALMVSVFAGLAALVKATEKTA